MSWAEPPLDRWTAGVPLDRPLVPLVQRNHQRHPRAREISPDLGLDLDLIHQRTRFRWMSLVQRNRSAGPAKPFRWSPAGRPLVQRNHQRKSGGGTAPWARERPSRLARRPRLCVARVPVWGPEGCSPVIAGAGQVALRPLACTSPAGWCRPRLSRRAHEHRHPRAAHQGRIRRDAPRRGAPGGRGSR